MLSVIVPTRANETTWQTLLGDLNSLPASSEVIVVGPQFGRGEDPELTIEGAYKLRYCGSEQGRARQLNSGAGEATGDYLWFLHSDSRVPAESIAELVSAVQSIDRRELLYFKLAFQSDGPRLMWLNALGANLRSRLFGIPFGDQGFVVRRELFQELGMFDEQCLYGEDHLFVWKCRIKGVELRALRAVVATSARKYLEQGWLRTTTRHLLLTMKQALPELWRFCLTKPEVRDV